MFNPLLAAGLVLCVAVPAVAGAQSAATAPLSPPSASQTPASQPSAYRSAFEAYKPYTDEATGDWKALNATTAKIGGWRAYAKEARQPQAPDSAAEPGQGVSPATPTKP